MMLRILLPAAALLVATLSGTAHAQFACSTVARAGQLDPDGLVYGNVFRDEVAVNDAGDAVFVARANGARDKLYFYPSLGAGQVVARADGPAPNGGTFRSQRCFFSLSVNDADDVAFFAQLVSGQGVFVRDGGSLETAAVRSQASPGGGVFDAFPFVGDIDGASRVPFVATVDGGSGGVFVYDSTSNAVSTLVLDGAATLDGREVCSTQAVDLGLAGAAVIRATSKTSCANVAERDHRALPRERARRHDAASRRRCIADRWLDVREAARHAAPQRHGRRRLPCDHGRHDADRRDLRARRRHGHSDRRRARGRRGARGRRVVRCEPVVPLRGFENVLLNVKLRSTPAKFGVFDLGVVDAPALVKTDAPPTDAFGAGSSYTRFSRTNGASEDGFRIGVQVRVRDTNPPSAKGGVVRCAGSASGAFIDGEAFF